MSGQGVFDAHAHLARGPEPLRRLLECMDAVGISRAVVVAGAVLDAGILSRQMAEGGGTDVDADNEAVRESCAASAGRLVPFYFANPHRGAGPYERQGNGYRGLKLAPAVHGVALDDKRTDELAAVAERFGHPVYLHCLGRPGYAVPDLVALARRHPDVRFILGHGGVGDLDLYGIGLIAPEPNIAFETSGGYSFVIGAAVQRLGPLRVLFGTEYPLQHPSVELTKYRVLSLPDPVWEEIGWNNIARLTGEPLR
jgi:uncharacterized protein